MPPSLYRSYLSSPLSLNGIESEVYVQSLETLTGETVSFTEFSPFTRGILVIDPEATNSQPEIVSFTGTDSTGIGFTGLTRGLSSIDSSSRVTGNMPYHPIGTPVIISWGAQNISDLIAYINSLISGTVGYASLINAGTTKLTSNMANANSPRSRHAYVGQNTVVGTMTLVTNPMAIQTNSGVVVVPQTTTSSYTAPTGNPRIDLLCYNTITAALAYRTGTTGVSPTAPLPQEGDVVMCSIYHRVGETKLLEQDDTVNGYILNWYEPIPYSVYPPTGSMLAFGGSTAPTGWLLCDGTAYSRTTYASLYAVISTSYGAGDGSTTFNVPDLRSRGIIGYGTGTETITISSITSSIITCTTPNGPPNSANNIIQNGAAVIFNGTSSGNLTHGNTYYIVRVTYNTFSLASSVANAVGAGSGSAGTPTIITLASQTGTFTLSFSARSLGDSGGEESHSSILAESPSHFHTIPAFSSGGGNQGFVPSQTSSDGNVNSAASGGSLAHNTMSPFAVAAWIIKS